MAAAGSPWSLADPTGRRYNLTLVTNTPAAERTYQSLVANVSYRLSALQLGANYTLGKMWGNANGENVGSGPTRAAMNTYPEYRQESWNYPMGYSPGDQRHKVRGMISYRVPVWQRVGALDLGLVQRFDSGVAIDITGSVDSRPYATVAAPGYLNPVSSVGYYFMPRGSFRFDSVWTTDLSVVWSKKIPQLRKTELFFRGVVTNLFNRMAQVNGDIGISTRVNNTAYTVFNPFVEKPVEGLNWAKGANFGKPQAPGDYQAARLFSFSLGVRF